MAKGKFEVQRKQGKYQGILYDMKTCSHCGRWGILGKHFSRNASKGDGHAGWCCECTRKYKRKHTLGYGSMVN